MQIAICVALTAFAARTALAQDHLTPDPTPPPEQYFAKIREVFADVLRNDIIVQELVVPSFQPEEIVGIRRSDKGFEAFASKPSSHVWLTFNGEKGAPDYRQIHVQTEARAISDALTERIRNIWRSMLLDARAPTEALDGLDGEDYYFSMPHADKPYVSATVWSPEKGKTVALVALGEGLAAYARGKADEAALIKLIEPLERTKA